MPTRTQYLHVSSSCMVGFQLRRDQWRPSQATGPHDVLHRKGALFGGRSCAIKVGMGTKLVWKRAIKKWHKPRPIPTTPFKAFISRKPSPVRSRILGIYERQGCLSGTSLSRYDWTLRESIEGDLNTQTLARSRVWTRSRRCPVCCERRGLEAGHHKGICKSDAQHSKAPLIGVKLPWTGSQNYLDRC